MTAILRNEVYLGNLVMNYLGSRSYKDSRMVRKPSSELIRCEGAHEAIIERETWDAVQAVNEAAAQRFAKKRSPSRHLFSGKLVCAGCGGPLIANLEKRTYKGNVQEYVSYHCGRHNTSGGSVCFRHTVYEKSLEQIVLAEIRSQAQAVVLDESGTVKKLKAKLAGYDEQRLSGIRQELAKLRRRVQELESTTAKLYEGKYSGAISESAFIMLMRRNEQERIAKKERLDALQSEVDDAAKETASIQSWVEIVRKHLSLQELDRLTVDELIDHIEVGERTIVGGQRRQDIKVFYQFVGLIE